jgi:hypothetical protein
MRVKLCAGCPYTPRDLAGHYDPEAILHLCANCDGEQKASTNEYSRKAERRQKCATIPNIPVTAQPSVARSATESSGSSGAIPGGPPSVQRSALNASGPVRNVTADGYVGSNLLDSDCGEHHATNRDNPAGGNHLCAPPPNVFHSADTVFCFALGGAT